MERNGGRHHLKPAAVTSGDPYGPMDVKEFCLQGLRTFSWFPPTKVTVIFIKRDNCIGPLRNCGLWDMITVYYSTTWLYLLYMVTFDEAVTVQTV